ncbi:mitotic deacetylase associated SANT domain protein a isoform X3 [Micropterus dolomieu]|uniref:mitotic deacetylase associated SANT domain protein a isoform X3 n=1 Tax=Micropterus dolomieu TaxID=147949 RepID=UPI001E8EBEA7|nr:mitotic deacetylase associated SANT domain protein a isoform X3 [Micropterus dolomieu]
MSLPPQVNTDKSGKHRAAAMKEPVQHSGEVYYGMGPPALESSHSDSASSSGVYTPEKGPQSLPHYQQAAPVKWIHQDSIQAPGWSQEAPVPAWGQNFGPYMSGVNVRGQMAFHKGVHEGVALPMGGENPLPGPVEAYRDTTQAQSQGRGLEWEQHAAAAMHQAQLQVYQHAHKGVELQGNKGVASLAYGEQSKTQQQQQQQHLLHQMQQQQMHHRQQQQQQQQQQQLHQQHQLQLQQQQHMQKQQHQIQQHQMQQLQQMQQQYHQQQLQERQQQERQQQIQQMQQQQLQQKNVPQQETTQVQMQPKQQQTQNFVPYRPPEPCSPDTVPKKEDVKSVELHQEPDTQISDASSVPDPCPEKIPTNPAEPSDSPLAAPRRSRRLSRDGQSPLGPPSANLWSQASKEPPPPQNGVAVPQAVKGGESQVTTGGVIQITSRRRRASKEINLETLAQKASEMESLPAKMIKQEDGPSGRQATMVPLVIPVSVPVHKSQTDPLGGWAQGRLGLGERPAGLPDCKPSVIVARRRSLRKSESFGQEGDNDPGLDEDGKSKFKRRPRPEPLIIPPHKPSTFIPPSLYSSITSYQSNLRSPVRLPDNPLTLPPYTPPPILSPVREGSGLYFSTFLTNIASNQILPPPATPKSATRSLLRSASSDITPPVLPLITDAAPASLEPRINIGQKYQAEIPELQDQLSSQFDEPKADLVWVPVDDSQLKHSVQERMEDLMNMACSSVFRGGGTNQELVLHCLHECGGDFLDMLGRLMLQDPVFPKGHHLTGYHYSGSDCWTAEEKRYFNKGISAYRKDFIMVQKLVQTKTVAQCVEFYYTYKKQVKIGRNGILTFGPPDSPEEKHTEAVVDVKSSQQSILMDDKLEVSYDQSLESSQQARIARSLQAHDYAGTMVVLKEPNTVKNEAHHPAAAHGPRAEPAAKKSKAPPKPPPDPDAEFPCKKCGRVFYKVKSRSAHMKSHAEQEKKAAALRQKEEEEQAAAEARARKVAAAAAAAAAAAGLVAHQGGNGNGVTEQAEVSSHEDSSEGEDDDDEDWH